ncbi:MAG: SpoIIE family protein phosphatase [Leptospiraceae bacterium]|nr:SpoIIE family protein phosphatase [Leptospiraceae bacterium]
MSKDAQPQQSNDSNHSSQFGQSEQSGQRAVGKTQPTGGHRKLAYQIGFLYTILAMANIIFFSAVIFENQTDLLSNSFRYQADNIAQAIMQRLSEVSITPDNSAAHELLAGELAVYDTPYLYILGADAAVWYAHSTPDSSPPEIDTERLRELIFQLRGEESLIFARYHLELNEDDFSIRMLVPLNAHPAAFVYTTLSLQSMRDRLNEIYIQMAIAVIWSVIFHAVFALFLYRLIFRRLDMLKAASRELAAGHLESRADWERKRHDELDELGDTFNYMSRSIQQNVERISNLNREIQAELEIGKDVQQLVIGKETAYDDMQPAVYYRPLREVSGDVFKFYNRKRNQRALFFADATGHGVSAALITSLMIQTMDHMIRDGRTPAELIRELNDRLEQRLRGAYFSTCVLMYFHKNKIEICNAGHLPVYFIPTAGNYTTVESSGPPVGLMHGFTYENESVKVKSGDRIFIFTDGLTDCMDAEEREYSLERARDMILKHRRAGTHKIAEYLQKDFESHTTEYIDDVTFMLLEVP